MIHAESGEVDIVSLIVRVGFDCSSKSRNRGLNVIAGSICRGEQTERFRCRVCPPGQGLQGRRRRRALAGSDLAQAEVVACPLIRWIRSKQRLKKLSGLKRLVLRKETGSKLR